MKATALLIAALLTACGGGDDTPAPTCEIQVMPNGERVCVFHSTKACIADPVANVGCGK